MTKSIIGKFCCAVVLATATLTFTPFGTADHQFERKLLGVRNTLWVSLVITYVLLFITVISSLILLGYRLKG